mmetsp:Transcript_2785/g.8733  ORF Transcript_2785/g.8733 Transcript_2785/m.8733 type:complete len:1241 (+) Transcript_2785:200-3922(+)
MPPQRSNNESLTLLQQQSPGASTSSHRAPALFSQRTLARPMMRSPSLMALQQDFLAHSVELKDKQAAHSSSAAVSIASVVPAAAVHFANRQDRPTTYRRAAPATSARPTSLSSSSSAAAVSAPNSSAEVTTVAAAISHVAYSLSDLVLVHPLSARPDSQYLGEECSAWSQEGVRNCFDRVVTVKEMQVRRGAGRTLHGAAAAGSAVALLTPSDALHELAPELARMHASRTPAAVHVVSRGLGDRLALHTDHSAVMSVRGTGVVILASRALGHEPHDMAVAAQLAAVRLGRPVLHCTDGVAASHNSNRLQVSDAAELEALLEETNALRLDEQAHLAMQQQQQQPSSLAAAAQASALATERQLEEVFDSVESVFGRRYAPVEYVGHAAAQVVLVMLSCGGATVAEQVVRQRARHERIGLLLVRCLRPWPASQLRAQLPASARTVAVVDFVGAQRGRAGASSGGPLYLDVCGALVREPNVQVCSVRLGPQVASFQPAFAGRLCSQLLGQSAWQSADHLSLGTGSPDDLGELAADLQHEVPHVLPKRTQQVVFLEESDAAAAATTPPQHQFTLGQRAALAIGELPRGKFHVQLQLLHDSYADALSEDSQLSGATVSQLRFGPVKIDAPYPVEPATASLVVVRDSALLQQLHSTAYLAPSGKLLLDTDAADPLTLLPPTARRLLYTRDLSLYVVDATAAAAELGCERADVLVSATLLLSGVAGRATTRGRLIEHVQPKLRRWSLKPTSALELTAGGHGHVHVHGHGSSGSDLSVLCDESLLSEDSSLEQSQCGSELDSESGGAATAPIVLRYPENSLLTRAPAPESDALRRTPASGWRHAAFAMLFPRQYALERQLHPARKEGAFELKVVACETVTPPDYERTVFTVDLEIQDPDVSYQGVGECLSVWGENDPVRVQAFLQWLGVPADRVVSLPVSADQPEQVYLRSAYAAFSQSLDLFGRLTKRFLGDLLPYAPNEEIADHLRYLMRDSDALSATQEEHCFASLLQEYNIRVPLDRLVAILPLVHPRLYSISSSGSLNPRVISLLVVTHTWQTPNKENRVGQCSRYLEHLKPGDVIVGALRPSVLVPPKDTTRPVVMVGLGTGLAPFVAFLQHGLHAHLLGQQVGPRYLAFGARSWREYSGAAEITAYNQGERPLLTHLRLAFSRDSTAKVYVQHKLAEDGEIIADMLLRQGGSFYLCGGVQPVPAIKAALLSAFEEYGGLSANEAAITLERLKSEERYVLEVY